MNSSDPATWFAAMAEIEEYAPLMAYLVRSMQAGGELRENVLAHDDRQRRELPGRRRHLPAS